MEYLIDFLQKKDPTKAKIFTHLKCQKEEALVLRHIAQDYVKGLENISVNELLSEIFGNENYEQLKKLYIVKNLLELGWISQATFVQARVGEVSGLELLNSSVTLSVSFLKLLEEGNLEMVLPDISPYKDHLEYLKDQFFRIDLYQKLSAIKHNYTQSSPNIGRLKSKLQLLETRINERLKVTEDEILVEELFKEHGLNQKEQLIFLALLKEEYSSDIDSLRDMNVLIDLVSFDDYEKIKNRALLEEGSKLIESAIIDYDEMLTAFGGVARSFYVVEDILHKIIHPHKEKKSKKIKLEMLIKEQELFEMIDPKGGLEEVILDKKTKEVLDNLLRQTDKNVLNLLKEWGVKDKKKGVEAKIIFYGPPGTGKTLTAISLAKSLKKRVLSFDCSKILSMYVGESEKNVRKIFDTYLELANKTKSEPLLLLNEADQFLSARSVGSGASADKMHNQMQNIFLEQIENFSGVLVATTNLLENIDPAFSRRFDYKIHFEKPNFEQRVLIWQKHLPKNAPFEKQFNVETLAKHQLTGGQIKVVVKNASYKVAIKEKPIFMVKDFENEIAREIKGAFGNEKQVGFAL